MTADPTVPESVLDMGSGRPMLWLRADIDTWKAARA